MDGHKKEKSPKNSFSWLSSIHSLELWLLSVALLLAGGIWAFIELADEVFKGDTRKVDETILLMLRNPADLSDPLGPPWFEELMRDLTALGGSAILILITAAVVGFLLMQRKKGMAFFMTAAVFGGFLLSTLLKSLFDRPRPELVPHATYVMTASFPSGHSMLSAVVFLTLGGLLARYTKKRRLKVYVLMLSGLTTLLVGCSRVYLGVHWPTDVLAGWTAGASWAMLCWLAALVLQRQGRVEENLES